MKFLIKNKRSKTILIAFLIIVASIIIALDVRDEHSANMFLLICTILSFFIFMQLFQNIKRYKYRLTLSFTHLVLIFFYIIINKNDDYNPTYIFLLPTIVDFPISLILVPIYFVVTFLSWNQPHIFHFDIVLKLFFLTIGTLQYFIIGSVIDNRTKVNT